MRYCPKPSDFWLNIVVDNVLAVYKQSNGWSEQFSVLFYRYLHFILIYKCNFEFLCQEHFHVFFFWKCNKIALYRQDSKTKIFSDCEGKNNDVFRRTHLRHQDHRLRRFTGLDSKSKVKFIKLSEQFLFNLIF